VKLNPLESSDSGKIHEGPPTFSLALEKHIGVLGAFAFDEQYKSERNEQPGPVLLRELPVSEDVQCSMFLGCSVLVSPLLRYRE
jgi:hypothetical protein